MPAEAPRGYVVDDEEAVRSSLSLLLRSAGYEVATFGSGDAFLEAARTDLPFGCVLLDIRMPDLDGLQVQHALTERRLPHPVVMITAHGDVPLAVRAMKAGACDFIEKPFSAEEILRAAAAALESGACAQHDARAAADAAARVATLSPRETDVLQGMVAGRQNKVIALDLGISPRTVEIHRGNLMAKLGVRSLSEVVRIAIAAGIRTDGH
ncbi:response regulator transcription factor [Falsiroseomonas sp. HW251]|uniref:response regulator transcription factor n=1 Tax=Falsiroseomonas sp. HW251 TaxID=3390998 RepID=UPI003D323C5D